MRLKPLLLYILLLIPIFILSSYNNDDWKTKVDEELIFETRNGQQTDFIVVMNNQMVVDTKHLTTKDEKGTHVYNALRENAQNTQKEIKLWLKETEITHRSYYLVNMIHVKGSQENIKDIALRNDVLRININPSVEKRFSPAEAKEREINAIEWGIQKIKADQVWVAGYQGTGIVVGGQDTGYDWEHPTIKTQYRGWDGATADHNYNWHDAIHEIDAGNTGTNPCGLDSDVPCDDNNHGTHTMGTMVGDDGAGNQIGVAPGATWIACRNMERGDGTPVTYIECFEWFLAPTDIAGLSPDPTKAPHVINNSWGCPVSEGCNTGNFALMETALNNLKNAGVLVVVSAGNSGSACSTIDNPAAIFEESFSVGATNSSDAIAGFSSRGPVTVDGSNRMKPDIAAPGVSVRSCIIGTGFATYSGTSMAGPHIAGAAALIMDKHPSLIGDPDGIEDLIEMTAVPFTTNDGCGTDTGTSVPNNVFGHGVIDVLAAVNETLLPLNWLSFTGKNTKSQNELEWIVSEQINIAKYSIERSEDGVRFENIGQVVAQNEQGRIEYTYRDQSIEKDYYYRIQSLELDGSIEYSETLYLKASNEGTIVVYPNPVKDKLTIVVPRQYAQISYEIYNNLGQLILRDEVVNQSQINIDVEASWPNGVLWIQIKSGGNILSTQKVLVE